jgi:hypothetical protein
MSSLPTLIILNSFGHISQNYRRVMLLKVT